MRSSSHEWVCVSVVRHRHDAERLKDLFSNHDIPCWIRGGDAAGHLPPLAFVQGLRLMVPRAQSEQAKEILKSMDESRPMDEKGFFDEG